MKGVRTRSFLFGVVWVSLVLGCGPSPNGSNPIDGGNGNGDDGGPPVPGTLRIVPANAEYTVADGVPAQADYQAIFTNDEGVDEDVTSEATFTIDNPNLGSFSGGHFTSASDRGGHTEVNATARGRTASTGLTVRLSAIVIGPGAPPNAPELFGGAEDPSRAPSVVYPADRVLVPPNLSVLEFHFMPGTGNTLFEMRFLGSAIDLAVYLSCTPLGGGCVYQPDENVWAMLSEAERGQDLVSYTVRGVDGANPGAVGTSAGQHIGFGQEDIVGGIYYWNAGAGAVRRYEFGVSGQTAENYMDAARAGATTCVGCHVLSRDGSKIAVGLDIPAPSPYKVFDVATRGMIYQQGSTFGGGSNFFSFSPDAAEVMTSNGVNIAWRNATTGAAIDETLVDVGTMPDWSPDGTTLVYAKPQTAPPCIGGFCGAPGVDAASLEVIARNGAGWSAPQTLVAFSGQNNYYPTYSPDNQWVLFNRSPSNTNSFDAPDAQVWLVAAAGGNAIQLATASTGGDSWPKWAPDVQPYRGGQIMWFTFSSRRAYGLRLPAGTAQIWMAGFDPSLAAAGMDGSLPAFWLPFQELGSGNHIAQWVTEVERQPCNENGECATGEFCEEGECVPVIE
jgi:hypothetical protein